MNSRGQKREKKRVVSFFASHFTATAKERRWTMIRERGQNTLGLLFFGRLPFSNTTKQTEHKPESTKRGEQKRWVKRLCVCLHLEGETTRRANKKLK